MPDEPPLAVAHIGQRFNQACAVLFSSDFADLQHAIELVASNNALRQRDQHVLGRSLSGVLLDRHDLAAVPVVALRRARQVALTGGTYLGSLWLGTAY